MKMKSGTIGGSKAFTGYQAGRDGKTYVFAMIINNFDGPASAIVQKMYKVLDELKQ
jgi:D-alanyl-D-alanine carboxypeptidase/D-alanyl-D-alanine-endopeptidase (penicillin-binding protein 4)